MCDRLLDAIRREKVPLRLSLREPYRPVERFRTFGPPAGSLPRRRVAADIAARLSSDAD